MVIMAEPNPITPDGLFGIFLGTRSSLPMTGTRSLTTFHWKSRSQDADGKG